MKKTVVTFGLVSGAISSILMAGNMSLVDKIGFDKATNTGYTAIVLSFLLVFAGIKSYRDNRGGGQISFGKAFLVGILITLISCACYVATWEVIYQTHPAAMNDFMDKYAAHVIEKEKAAGASDAVLQQKMAEMAKANEMYRNPVFRAGFTFLEPFPVGLVITLLSAGILRKSRRAEVAAATV
jgi:hypothetical protein